MKRFITVSIFLLITLTLCVALASCMGGNTIKLEKCFTVVYNPSYDGYASAQLEVNKDYINSFADKEAILKAFKSISEKDSVDADIKSEFKLEMMQMEADSSSIPDLDYYMNFTVSDKNLNLSNGDTIHVKPVLNIEEKLLLEELGLSFDQEEATVTVCDLEDFQPTALNFDQIADIEFSGYNGYGYASVSYRKEYIQNLMHTEFRNDDNKLILGIGAEIFDVSFDQSYSDLKNGDQVTVNLRISEDYSSTVKNVDFALKQMGLQLSELSKTYTVSGLKECTGVIDVFEDFQNDWISYYGANGNGTPYEIVIPSDYIKQYDDIYLKGTDKNELAVIQKNTRIGTAYFHVQEARNLKNGDEIEISANFNNGNTNVAQELDQLGYIIPKRNHTAYVVGLGNYLTSIEQLTPTVISNIQETIINEISGFEAIEKLLFVTYKPGIECSNQSTAFVFAVVKESHWFIDDRYFPAYLYDIIIFNDGQISISDFDHSTWSSNKTVEDALARLDADQFEITELEC